MDATYFGLRHRPFRPTPDTDGYYPATGHEQAVARLARAVADDEGLALLTGAPGTGKTLLCHRLLETLGPDAVTVFLTNSHFQNRTGLLQAILYDLGLPYEGRGEQELRLALTDCLLKNFGAGRRTVLIVDEAQHLTPDLLEELRLLGNLEARQGKAVQVILVGQPELETQLHRPELAGLSQRLSVRLRLEPLGVHEAADYLFHQLRQAGGRPEQVLSGEAADLLARQTGGVPRVLNQAAYQALGLAQEAGTRQVDAEAALEALAALGLESDVPEHGPAEFPVLADTDEAAAESDTSGVHPVLTLTDEIADEPAAPELEMPDPGGRRFPTTQRPA